MSHPVSSLNYGSLVTYHTWTNAMQVGTSRNSFVFLICYKVRSLWRAQQEPHIPIDFLEQHLTIGESLISEICKR